MAAQNQGEIIVRRMNLFLNTEDRNNDVQAQDQATGQSINVPLQGLNIVAEDNQFIRLKLKSFCCNNTFDNHAASDQRAYLYMGSDTIPKAADSDPLPPAVLNHNYLMLSSYNTYADVMADTVNMVSLLFKQNGYTTADWDYNFTLMRGTGLGIPNPLFTTSPADSPTNGGYDTLGYYRQNGTKCLLGTFTMTQNKELFWGAAGSGLNYPPGSSGPGSGTCFDNTAASTSFFLTCAQSSDIYLLLGGRKQPFSTSDLASVANFTAAGIPLGTSASDSSKMLLFVGCTYVTTGTGAATRTTITVEVATIFRMQLQVENQLYLRSNLLSTNYATDNYNQTTGVQSSRELSASNIFASFKMNSNIIYYEDTGEDTWLLDIAQRNIPNLELFITNRHGDPLTLDNPNPQFQQTYNISFQCCIRVEIIERSMIQSTNAVRTAEGYANARYSGNVMNTVRQGQDLQRNSVFTRLATREVR